MKRILIGAIALLSLSGCSVYTQVRPDWGETYPPIEDPTTYPYPDLGTRRQLAESIALAHPRIQGTIEYAVRAYGRYHLTTTVNYLFKDNYDVFVRIVSPQTEVYRLRVNIFTRRVESIQSYNEGWYQ